MQLQKLNKHRKGRGEFSIKCYLQWRHFPLTSANTELFPNSQALEVETGMPSVSKKVDTLIW